MKKVSGVGRRHLLKNFFKRMNAPYDLRIRNAIDGEEMLHFALTKKSLYAFVSIFIVGSFLLLSFLFLFTPIKYYIPGFETQNSRNKIIQLQQQVDSLENYERASFKLVQNALNVMDTTMVKDTNSLSTQELMSAGMQNVEKVETRNKIAKKILLQPGTNRKK